MREKHKVEDFRWRAIRPRSPRWPWAVLTASAVLLVAAVLRVPAPHAWFEDTPVAAAAAPAHAQPMPAARTAAPQAPASKTAEPSQAIPVIPAVRQAVRVPTDTPAVAEPNGAATAGEPERRQAEVAPQHRKPLRTRRTPETRITRSYERSRSSYGHMPPWAASAFGLGFGRW